VVNFAFLPSPQQTFPTVTLGLGRLGHTLELWQGAHWVANLCSEADEEAGIPGKPPCARQLRPFPGQATGQFEAVEWTLVS
jgi:hypothetical protein